MKMSGFSLTFPWDGDSGCLLVLVGNTHLHWGWVPGKAKTHTDQGLRDLISWDTPHLATPLDSRAGRVHCSDRWTQVGNLDPLLIEKFHQGIVPLIYASVVPAQRDLLRSYPFSNPITLKDIPLSHTYPTLGVDRALALWAAGQVHGWPAIVIDGGTALTLTGGNERGELVGGAILPGLGLQFRSLFQHTAALPLLALEALPDRWARNTPDAILSGVAHSLLAGVQSFLQDWLQLYPQTQICFTGGDGQWLYQHLLPWLRAQEFEHQSPSHPLGSDRLIYGPHLGLWGMVLVID
jgi:type III pantothenate kinase